jgi:hypothetical protein
LDGAVFGFICKSQDITARLSREAQMVFNENKLPLVLDLDDTLVRAVGAQRMIFEFLA